MSYRELRNFTELLRQLGYPRLISLENFRRPNFELVADILYWMTKLYDPDTTISDRVEYEGERVEFLTQIAALMAAKARIKLNTKKIYAADGRAVQELLKIASVLSRAVSSATVKLDDGALPPIKIQDVKAARVLASEITQSGARLFDMLAYEAKERQERIQALRFLDLASSAGADGSREQAFVERSARELVEATRKHVEDARKECEELEVDERNLEAKIRKRQEELERTEKRLRSLEGVRPQFMEETERLEQELQRQYELYIERHRNLDYLEHELEKFHLAEEERREEQQRKLVKMRERLLRDEVEILRGDRDGEAEEYQDRARAAREKPTSGDYGSRKSAATAAVARAQIAQSSRSRVTGSLSAQGSDDESSEEDTDGSGSGSGALSDEDDLSVSHQKGVGRRAEGSEQGSDDLLDDDGDESGSDDHF